jgi:glycosyltransferase involved in cell wall biosynthesis
LRAAGHEVAIAAPRADASGPERYQYEGTDVFRYPIPGAATHAEAQGRVPVRGAEAFGRWVASVHPDVVHMHTFVTGLGLDEIVAAKEAGARVIVTTHASSHGFLCQRGTLMWRGETICDGHLDVRRCAACELEHRGLGRTVAEAIGWIPVGMSRFAARMPGKIGTALGMSDLIAWNRLRQERMLSLVDRFVVLTARAAAIVVDNGAPVGKVVVNRLGVSQDFGSQRRSGSAASQPVSVGYLGRFDPIKGVFDLASAVRSLPRYVPIRCEFRGPLNAPADRKAADEVRRLADGDSRVTIADAVSSDRVPELMRSYDVVCCPSRCLEGGPTTGLEAIASGTPVIAANVGGVAEILADGVNGRLIPPGDSDALASALEEVACHPQVLDTWRQHLPRVRTMDEVAVEYQALYAA